MKKVKYDKWFIVVLGIMLWTLLTMLVDLTSLLPQNWGNFNLWMRVVACAIAVYGDIWVFRIYIGSIKKQAAKLLLLEEQLKEHPELKETVYSILKG